MPLEAYGWIPCDLSLDLHDQTCDSCGLKHQRTGASRPRSRARCGRRLEYLARQTIAAIGREVPYYVRPLEGPFGRARPTRGRAVAHGASSTRSRRAGAAEGAPLRDPRCPRPRRAARGPDARRAPRPPTGWLGARLAWDRFMAAGEAARLAPATRPRTSRGRSSATLDAISAESVAGFTQEQGHVAGAVRSAGAGPWRSCSPATTCRPPRLMMSRRARGLWAAGARPPWRGAPGRLGRTPDRWLCVGGPTPWLRRRRRARWSPSWPTRTRRGRRGAGSRRPSTGDRRPGARRGPRGRCAVARARPRTTRCSWRAGFRPSC